jgi:GMP synthase (glutamine-hydrolysing)
MFELELQRTLTQVPIVSIPLGFEQGIGGHSIVIRTFITNDFMTGVPAVPGQDISLSDTVQMTNAVATADPAIARVMYDLTSKPPGTTEWE